MRKFGEWVHSYRNGFGRRPAFGEVGPIVLRIADVSSGVIDLKEPRRGRVSEKEAAIYKLEPGDLLFIRVNGARDIVGRCCVVGEDVPDDTIFNDHLIRVRLKSGLDPQFAKLCVSLPVVRSIIEEAASTSAGQLTINQDILHSIEIPDVSLDDQRRIAVQLKTQLAAVEQARQAAEVQLNDAQQLVPGILGVAFLEITEGSFVKLGDIASIQLGKMLSPKSKTGKQSFAYLRNTNVQWGRFDLRDLAVMDFSDRERVKFELQAGDLIVCEGGEPGRCAVWNAERTDCYYQKALHRVRPHRGTADSEFLSYWIRQQAYVGSFEEQNAKTTIAHLPLVRLEQLPIPQIPIEKQRRVAEGLNSSLAAVDEVVRAAQAQLAEIRQVPSRLLAQAFGES
ncbi:MAG TPA: restriction endonuclease subunit S [Nitrospira sp.]|nr:restriction endonuclease subunit S [Nitrospira sp.]